MVTQLEALLSVVELLSAVKDSEGNYYTVQSVDLDDETIYAIYDEEDYYITFEEILSLEYTLYKEVQVDLIYDVDPDWHETECHYCGCTIPIGKGYGCNGVRACADCYPEHVDDEEED
jgi:hypothetical protein